MNTINFHIDPVIAPYVNCIFYGEDSSSDAHLNIPLYADGYPGIMFQESNNGFFRLPKTKELSELFLYGQTINPISLDVKGPYSYVVVQLYPFASKYLLDVEPRELNDECYDLLQIEQVNTKHYRNELAATANLKDRVNVISALTRELIESHQVAENNIIHQAIAHIIQGKGNLKIKDVLQKLPITERTFERNFKSYIGLSPKQFSRIIQFQTSLNQLTDSNFKKLTDVGFDSGFTDQSHFIRTFKTYTGQTPSFYLRNA